jgi:hypothetical protein
MTPSLDLRPHPNCPTFHGALTILFNRIRSEKSP